MSVHVLDASTALAWYLPEDFLGAEVPQAAQPTGPGAKGAEKTAGGPWRGPWYRSRSRPVCLVVWEGSQEGNVEAPYSDLLECGPLTGIPRQYRAVEPAR